MVLLVSVGRVGFMVISLVVGVLVPLGTSSLNGGAVKDVDLVLMGVVAMHRFLIVIFILFYMCFCFLVLSLNVFFFYYKINCVILFTRISAFCCCCCA